MTTPGSQVDAYQPVIGLVITVCGEMGRLGSEIASFFCFLDVMIVKIVFFYYLFGPLDLF